MIIQKNAGFRPGLGTQSQKIARLGSPSRNPEFTFFDSEPGFPGRLAKPRKPGQLPWSENLYSIYFFILLWIFYFCSEKSGFSGIIIFWNFRESS